MLQRMNTTARGGGGCSTISLILPHHATLDLLRTGAYDDPEPGSPSMCHSASAENICIGALDLRNSRALSFARGRSPHANKVSFYGKLQDERGRRLTWYTLFSSLAQPALASPTQRPSATNRMLLCSCRISIGSVVH